MEGIASPDPSDISSLSGLSDLDEDEEEAEYLPPHSPDSHYLIWILRENSGSFNRKYFIFVNTIVSKCFRGRDHTRHIRKYDLHLMLPHRQPLTYYPQLLPPFGSQSFCTRILTLPHLRYRIDADTEVTIRNSWQAFTGLEQRVHERMVLGGCCTRRCFEEIRLPVLLQITQ